MAEKTLEKGDIIYREGDVPDFAYIIVSGKVELIETNQGRETRIRFVEAGKTLGEYAIFDPHSIRPFTARAAEKTTLISVSEEEFRVLLLQCPEVLQPFLFVALEKMRTSKIKEKAATVAVVESDVSTITIAPEGDLMKAQFKPIAVTPDRLPFRIGGYPEGGEINRRDQLHLYISSQANPLKVSRQHCEIVIENNGVHLIDLGSRFCTSVNGLIVGRGRGMYNAPLQKGVNNVTLGASDSPYRLKVTCE